MKIAASNAKLMSSHHYHEVNRETVKKGTVIAGLFDEEVLKNHRTKKAESEQNGKRDRFERSDEDPSDSAWSFTPGSLISLQKTSGVRNVPERDLKSLRQLVLEKIIAFMETLMEKKNGQSNPYVYEALGIMKNSLAGQNTLYMVTYERQSYYHHEEESTSFQGTGRAVTEDGRVIDFNLSFSASRSFTEEMSLEKGQIVTLTDPLVVNFGGSALTEISDQSFFFDIDSDGVKDEIHGLSGSSGFLALDKNGNDRIDDGSELFGTKSGDGFKDLEKYDEDKNGWIDENDEVYSKLKVWCRDENGNEALMGLKELNIGAIFLDRADTDFTERSMDLSSDFAVKGKIRKTGIFLRESGGVGSLQQVDLARA